MMPHSILNSRSWQYSWTRTASPRVHTKGSQLSFPPRLASTRWTNYRWVTIQNHSSTLPKKQWKQKASKSSNCSHAVSHTWIKPFVYMMNVQYTFNFAFSLLHIDTSLMDQSNIFQCVFLLPAATTAPQAAAWSLEKFEARLKLVT